MALRNSWFAGAGRSRFISIGASLMILITAAVILRRQFPSTLSANVRPPAYMITPFDMLGTMAAVETETLAGASGTIVVWKLQDVQKTPVTLWTMQQAYDKRIAQSSGLRIVARVEERSDLSAALRDPAAQVLPAARFLALLDQYRDVDVIVLLGAVPVLKPGDYARLPDRRPRVLAVDTMRLPEKRLFAEHVLHVAIVTRVPPLADPAATPAEWVNKFYMLVTADNAATLPL